MFWHIATAADALFPLNHLNGWFAATGSSGFGVSG
jgi:hypothetical protein